MHVPSVARPAVHEPLTGDPYRGAAMQEEHLDEAILFALRRSPGSRSNALAEAVGLPRTNFGRQLKNRLQQPLARLLSAELVEEDAGRYYLTEKGRRRLAERITAVQ